MERMKLADDGEYEICASCGMKLTEKEFNENEGLCDSCYEAEMRDRDELQHPDKPSYMDVLIERGQRE